MNDLLSMSGFPLALIIFWPLSRGRAIRWAGADLVMGSCLTAAMVWKGMGKGAGGGDNTLWIYNKNLKGSVINFIFHFFFFFQLQHNRKFSVEKYSSYPSIKKVWTDRRTDRPQMTHIRTWPRSCPDKHSDQVWKFLVTRKVFQLSQHKKVDKQTDGQTMWLLYFSMRGGGGGVAN